MSRCRQIAVLTATAISAAALGSPAFASEPPAEPNRAAVRVIEAGSSDVEAEQATGSTAATSEETSAQSRIQPVSPAFSARGEDLPDFMLGGFAEATAAFSDRESGSGAGFFSTSFNPALFVRFRDFLLFESELEISVTDDGDTEAVLEYGQFDLLLHDNLVLVFGKFLSPVGQFAERLHPAWINRLPNTPAGFGHDGLQPGAEVGVQARGGVQAGRSRFTYALAIGNGPRLMEDGALDQAGFGGDDNDDKAVSGRIGFLPVPHLEFGASFQTAKVRPMIGPEETMAAFAGSTAAADPESMASGPDTRFRLWGIDGAYTRGPWDIRVEFLRGTRESYTLGGSEPAIFPKMKLTAWYVQIAYQLSGITQKRILQNLEPVVRYGEFTIKGMPELAEENQEKRWDVGLNYWFSPAIVLHGALEHRNLTGREGGGRKDTRFLVQLGYGF